LPEAVSVPANIADTPLITIIGTRRSREGFKKRGIQDKKRYFNIAQASLEESRYYLILARDLNYSGSLCTSYNALFPILQEVSKLLEAYSASILNPGS
jgi:four helix bundle protein